jgi:hypothetical protein
VLNDIERSGWAIWPDQEDEQAATRLGVPVAQMRADEISKCLGGIHDPPLRRDVQQGLDDLCFRSRPMRGWPPSIFKLWWLGIPRGLEHLGHWLVDLSIGGIGSAAFSWVAPGFVLTVLTGWRRWARWVSDSDAGLMSKRKQLHNGDILPADKETAAERADRLTDR